MKVNEANLIISFAVNNGDFQELSKIKQCDTPYYLAVSAMYAKSKFSITKYSCGKDDASEETKQSEQEVLSNRYIYIAIRRQYAFVLVELQSLSEQQEISKAKVASLEQMVRELRGQIRRLQV